MSSEKKGLIGGRNKKVSKGSGSKPNKKSEVKPLLPEKEKKKKKDEANK